MGEYNRKKQTHRCREHINGDQWGKGKEGGAK